MPIHVDPDNVVNDALTRVGATVLEEALVAAALTGDEVVPLRVRVKTGDAPGTLRLGVERTGRDPVELLVSLVPGRS